MTADLHTIGRVEGTPPIVHICDVHGYLDDARSALRAVGQSDRFEPVVTSDADGSLHWADNEYVLVFNGDVIDRGPRNEACLELVWRLQREAPAGRVRFLLGNHEMAILLPSLVQWPGAYSTGLQAEERRRFLRRIPAGDVTVAFEGYEYTYSHAGSNEPFNVPALNAKLRAAATDLLDAKNPGSRTLQQRIQRSYRRLFAFGADRTRGPDAGVCWMDFSHLDRSAPKQIVGHTKRVRPVRKGNVICGNVIRMNSSSSGGEGVLVETPRRVDAVIRGPDGSVTVESVAGNH